MVSSVYIKNKNFFLKITSIKQIMEVFIKLLDDSGQYKTRSMKDTSCDSVVFRLVCSKSILFNLTFCALS